MAAGQQPVHGATHRHGAPQPGPPHGHPPHGLQPLPMGQEAPNREDMEPQYPHDREVQPEVQEQEVKMAETFNEETAEKKFTDEVETRDCVTKSEDVPQTKDEKESQEKAPSKVPPWLAKRNKRKAGAAAKQRESTEEQQDKKPVSKTETKVKPVFTCFSRLGKSDIEVKPATEVQPETEVKPVTEVKPEAEAKPTVVSKSEQEIKVEEKTEEIEKVEEAVASTMVETSDADKTEGGTDNITSRAESADDAGTNQFDSKTESNKVSAPLQSVPKVASATDKMNIRSCEEAAGDVEGDVSKKELGGVTLSESDEVSAPVESVPQATEPHTSTGEQKLLNETCASDISNNKQEQSDEMCTFSKSSTSTTQVHVPKSKSDVSNKELEESESKELPTKSANDKEENKMKEDSHIQKGDTGVQDSLKSETCVKDSLKGETAAQDSQKGETGVQDSQRGDTSSQNSQKGETCMQDSEKGATGAQNSIDKPGTKVGVVTDKLGSESEKNGVWKPGDSDSTKVNVETEKELESEVNDAPVSDGAAEEAESAAESEVLSTTTQTGNLAPRDGTAQAGQLPQQPGALQTTEPKAESANEIEVPSTAQTQTDKVPVVGDKTASEQTTGPKALTEPSAGHVLPENSSDDAQSGKPDIGAAEPSQEVALAVTDGLSSDAQSDAVHAKVETELKVEVQPKITYKSDPVRYTYDEQQQQQQQQQQQPDSQKQQNNVQQPQNDDQQQQGGVEDNAPAFHTGVQYSQSQEQPLAPQESVLPVQDPQQDVVQQAGELQQQMEQVYNTPQNYEECRMQMILAATLAQLPHDMTIGDLYQYINPNILDSMNLPPAPAGIIQEKLAQQQQELEAEQEYHPATKYEEVIAKRAQVKMRIEQIESEVPRLMEHPVSESRGRGDRRSRRGRGRGRLHGRDFDPDIGGYVPIQRMDTTYTAGDDEFIGPQLPVHLQHLAHAHEDSPPEHRAHARGHCAHACDDSHHHHQQFDFMAPDPDAVIDGDDEATEEYAGYEEGEVVDGDHWAHPSTWGRPHNRGRKRRSHEHHEGGSPSKRMARDDPLGFDEGDVISNDISDFHRRLLRMSGSIEEGHAPAFSTGVQYSQTGDRRPPYVRNQPGRYVCMYSQHRLM